jgi:hypothetical protein
LLHDARKKLRRGGQHVGICNRVESLKNRCF